MSTVTGKTEPRRSGLLRAFAVTALNAAGVFSFGVEPVMTSQLRQQLQLSSRAVAVLVAAEWGGAMLAALPASFWSRRVAARAVAVSAALLFMVANIVSACHQSYLLLLASRVVAGLAGGTLAILTLMVAAQASQPARLYGWWVLGQTLLAVPGLMLFTPVSIRFGLGMLYAIMAAAMASTLPLAWVLDPIRAAVIEDSRTAGLNRSSPAHTRDSAVAVLLVLFVFYAMANGLWAFAAERGSQLRLPSDRVDSCLSTAYLISLGGAALAAWIGTAARCRLLALLGHAALAISALLFGLATGLAGLATSAMILQFAWAFTAPLLLAMAARLEPAGWAMGLANLLLSAGLAVGPIVTGLLWDTQHGPRTIGWVVTVVLACNVALLRTARRMPGVPRASV